MAILGIDLGGTKLALAVFNQEGKMIFSQKIPLAGRTGHAVGALVREEVNKLLNNQQAWAIDAIGISVPGISRGKTGTVWAPNIPGWEDYPLSKELQAIAGDRPVVIDNDRACSIMGELWQGAAKGLNDAIFLAVGTGIGAGIVANGTILRGAHDIAGAIGWLDLGHPFHAKYSSCGFFEHHASGVGLVKMAKEMVKAYPGYTGMLKDKEDSSLSADHIFEAYAKNDALAVEVVQQAVSYWGMACANLVSLFDPEMIVFGGGVFGPAIQLIPLIENEAKKWAQPIAITQVSFRSSALGNGAGVYGAAYLAFKAVAAQAITTY